MIENKCILKFKLSESRCTMPATFVVKNSLALTVGMRGVRAITSQSQHIESKICEDKRSHNAHDIVVSPQKCEFDLFHCLVVLSSKIHWIKTSMFTYVLNALPNMQFP